MNDKPEDCHLEEFILKEGERDSVLVDRIKKAWGQVHKKPMEKKNCVAKPPYTQWVKERVAMFRLRYPVVTCERPPSPPPVITITMEEALELKNKVVELEEKNEEWENKYLQVVGELARMKREQEKKEENLLKGKKRLKESEEKRGKIGDGLLSAEDNLRAYKEEIRRLEQSYGRVDEFWKKAVKEKKEWRMAHEEQVSKTLEVEKKLRAEVHRVREFENLYLQEEARLEYLQNNIQDRLDRHVEAHVSHITMLKEELESLKVDCARRGKVLEHVWEDATELWKDNAKLKRDFVKMAAFSNAVIDDMPNKLADAEVDMIWHDPPKSIRDFIEYCRVLLDTYKKAVKTAKQHLAA